jgi:ferritin-like metal-binding protein YciE
LCDQFIFKKGAALAKVTSLQALMIECLRDLRAGEADTLDRFPAVVDAVTDARAAGALRRRLSDARHRAESLDTLGEKLGTEAGGEDNIWMRGMIDDAEGDMQTEEPGPLLDLALIGAVRKMVNASLVSYETAIAVADRLGNADASAAFTAARGQEEEAEQSLRAALFAIAAGS